MSADLLSPYECQNRTIANNATDITGGATDSFPTSGTFTGIGTFRISVCLDTATTLLIRATPTGGSATNFTLFGGSSLAANTPATCILKVPNGMSFTFRCGASCVVQWMTVEPVTGGVI